MSSIFSVSVCTLISRIFGLLRDIFIFSAFGTNGIISAFLFAFTIPNLFRRLLGEGAFSSALVPIFSDEYNKFGKSKAFILFNRITSRLIVVLLVIIFLGIFLLLCGYNFEIVSAHWKLCFLFSAILLPYMFFVCLAAVFSAVLSVFNNFLLAASSSIWLNFTMIFAIILGKIFKIEIQAYILCGGVIFGGVIQIMILYRALRKYGWKFNFDLSACDQVKNFQKLFLPGVIGAATVQINIAISRILSNFISVRAVSVIYLATRFVELPLGLFVAAIATVIFPVLSKFESQGEKFLLKKEFDRGIFLVLMLIFPSIFGIYGLDKSILNLLFCYGKFTLSDINLVLPVLRILLLSLPFCALSMIFTRMYHSKKNTFYPMITSVIDLVVNLILTLCLMSHFKILSIAIANLLSAILQMGLLYFGLIYKYNDVKIYIFNAKNLKLFLSGLLMCGIICICDKLIGFYFYGKFLSILSICINVPLGIILYIFFCWFLLNSKDRKPVLDKINDILRKFSNKNSKNIK